MACRRVFSVNGTEVEITCSGVKSDLLAGKENTGQDKQNQANTRCYQQRDDHFCRGGGAFQQRRIKSYKNLNGE